MLTWKMTQTLTQSDSVSWEKLVKETLGSGVHPGRAHGFCLAREALRLCLIERGLHLPIAKLKLETFDQLEDLPKLTLSLSHTGQWGAALVGDRHEYQSLGIDVESTLRKVNPDVLKRISHPMDADLASLELWCLKEATFKALMNTRQFEKNIEFRDLCIQSPTQTWHHTSGLQGEWSLATLHDQVLAMAWIKN